MPKQPRSWAAWAASGTLGGRGTGQGHSWSQDSQFLSKSQGPGLGEGSPWWLRLIKRSRTIARLILSTASFLFPANRFRKWGCG